jgi:hypothetical protein
MWTGDGIHLPVFPAHFCGQCLLGLKHYSWCERVQGRLHQAQQWGSTCSVPIILLPSPPMASHPTQAHPTLWSGGPSSGPRRLLTTALPLPEPPCLLGLRPSFSAWSPNSLWDPPSLQLFIQRFPPYWFFLTPQQFKATTIMSSVFPSPSQPTTSPWHLLASNILLTLFI